MSLIGTMDSGVSALRTFQKGLEVIGNNIANVNTTGFKSADAFRRSFERKLGVTPSCFRVRFQPHNENGLQRRRAASLK